MRTLHKVLSSSIYFALNKKNKGLLGSDSSFCNSPTQWPEALTRELVAGRG